MLWLAVTLAVLSVAVQPTLGHFGKHVPVVGGLHALNAVAILVVTGWLTRETARRRADSQPTWAGTTSSGTRDSGARADRR
jgi:hypothetical protein